ncbi:MAG: hypothetical protein EOO43_11245 [Flavobacterium sp.]|jgi:uncharacterized protein YciI|nr:MAG: hypothetical protein EOO43_11245 [Flavobacterium sp.]
MKQYLVTGYDYTDEGALDRRLAVRQHHLDNAKKYKESGNYITGAAILDDADKMIGSVMMLQFENEEELEAWKKSEPYITQKVFESVDVKPIRMPNLS